jgi:hypothetical protein
MRLSPDKLLLPVILLPSANLNLRFLMDAVILLPLAAKLRFRVFKPHMMLLLLVSLCLFCQAIYSSSIANLLELGRIFPLIVIFICLSALTEIEKIPALFFNLLAVNLLVALANYTFSADALVEFGFNNKPFYEMYGRNTGALAFTGTAGFLSFINLYFLLTSQKSWSVRLGWMFMILAGLAVSGSKTYMLTGFLLCSVFLVLKVPSILSRPQNLFGIFFFTIFISGAVYAAVSFLKFQVLYQITRLGFFLSSGSLSSIDERFKKIEMFLGIQNENLLFHLIGTPKELLTNFGGTFDNDFLFFYVRFGAPTTLLLLTLISVYIFRFVKMKLFFVSCMLFVTMIGAFTIPVLSDPQSSIFIIILAHYLSCRANEEKQKSGYV